MRLSRRRFLATGTMLGFGSAYEVRARSLASLKIGVTDWNLGLSAKIEALALAKKIGFDGVEVSLGREPAGSKLLLDDPALQEQYLGEARKLGLGIAGTCCNILHKYPPKTNDLGPKWIADGIPITKKLNARVMLCPFFGENAPLSPTTVISLGSYWDI